MSFREHVNGGFKCVQDQIFNSREGKHTPVTRIAIQKYLNKRIGIVLSNGTRYIVFIIRMIKKPMNFE